MLSTKCIPWDGSTRGKGYGQRYDPVQKKQRGAHVMAWEEVHGPVPPGKVVMHVVCDNPPCVNVEHLGLGTTGDNNRDMAAKGRQRTGWEKRSRNKKGQWA